MSDGGLSACPGLCNCRRTRGACSVAGDASAWRSSDGQRGADRPVATPAACSSGLACALLVLAVVLAGLWLARKPIARGFIDRKFADAHVPARYTIEELALGHQRLTSIVIGDPRNPDLVADWVELETSVGLERRAGAWGSGGTGSREGADRRRRAVAGLDRPADPEERGRGISGCRRSRSIWTTDDYGWRRRKASPGSRRPGAGGSTADFAAASRR